MAEQLAKLNKGKLGKYPTSETIIGVDANGNPIYRKILKGTLTSPYSIVHGITNLDDVYRLDGYVKSASTTRPLSLAYYGDASWDSAISITSTNVVIEAGTSYLNAHTGYGYTITIEYTVS